MEDRPVLTAEWASEELAKTLHFTMEHLDPSEENDWDAMDEQRKDFFRCCVNSIVCRKSLLEIAGK